MRLLTNSMICFAVVVDKNGSPHDLNSAATIAAPAPLVDQLIPLIQAADNDYEPTSRNRPPHAALDSVLGQTGHLILDFDGPVCDLFAGTPVEAIAAHLRDVLRAEPIEPPTAIAETTDLFEILSYAASISPGLAARAETVMTNLELNAVATAAPAGYIHDTVAACRESGRSTTVISRHSAAAVRSYLTTHGLADKVEDVIARTPGQLQRTSGLVEGAIGTLGPPSTCTLVTASAEAIQATSHAGAHTIGYARAPGMRERLTTAGAETVIPSLADLVLRLRARPLPN